MFVTPNDVGNTLTRQRVIAVASLGGVVITPRMALCKRPNHAPEPAPERAPVTSLLQTAGAGDFEGFGAAALGGFGCGTGAASTSPLLTVSAVAVWEGFALCRSRPGWEHETVTNVIRTTKL